MGFFQPSRLGQKDDFGVTRLRRAARRCDERVGRLVRKRHLATGQHELGERFPLDSKRRALIEQRSNALIRRGAVLPHKRCLKCFGKRSDE